jgi:hypothetical protein
MNKSQKERLLHVCAWCNQDIAADEDVFGFGAKADPGIDLHDKEGEFVSLNLTLQEKIVFALVPSNTSSVKADGFDLIFLTCSEDCAQSLKDALELEKDVFEDDL